MKIVEISKILKDRPNLKHKFEDLLPELIKKLIKDTSSTITYNRFPSGDATSTPGVDGIVKNGTDCEFIPVGDSFWEIGTSGLTKINKDYDKRTAEFSDEIRSNTTFILIIPKYWSFETFLVDWQNQRSSQWKDVLVYDAGILNNWMEEHLNIYLWFLKELGITQTLLNCKLIEAEYNDLINCTYPQLNSQIFCEERENDKIIFFNELVTKNIIYVKSESRFESLGFVLSSILENKSEVKEDFIVVNDREAYNFLNKTLENKILILNFDNINELKIEQNKIIIPCCKNNFTGNGVELKIRGQRTMSRLLTGIGLEIQESTDVNFKSNGNLLIIRRLLAKDLIDKQPKWANSQDSFCISPLLLLQPFDITNDFHIKIAEYITGYNKELFLQKLYSFQDMEDCPFRIVGNFYQLYNLEESWFVLKKFMPTLLFDKICKILEFAYLNEQPNDTINLTNEGLKNSNLDSILKVLAFYAIDNEQNQTVVDNSINSLLDLERSDNYLISKNLHLLSECSPEKICSFLENQINGRTEYIFSLLKSDDYCYLLSPINYLLTLEKYKVRAINLLFELSTFDINYSYSNNPTSDLKEALMPQFNKNALSVREKADILKSKIFQNPNLVELYIEIITSTTCCIPISFNVRKPEYSDNPTYKDVGDFRKELDVVVLKQILKTNDISLINKIIDDYYFFPLEMFFKISDYIKENRKIFDDKTLYLIYKSTIEKLATIRKFQNNENWIDRKDYIPVFTTLIENAKPNDVFLQCKYMFEDYGDYIDLDDNDEKLTFEELEKKKNILRINALNSLLKSLGREKTIMSYIQNISDNDIWAKFLLEIFNDLSSIELIFDYCIDAEKLHLLSGVMNQISDKILSIRIFKEKVNGQIKNKLLPLLNYDEYESLCDNEEELKLFYSQKSVGIYNDCNEEKYKKFLQYNPVGLLDYFYKKVYDDNVYNKGLALLDVLRTKKFTIKHKHYLWELKEMFKAMEEYRYSEELALLELDFIDFFDHLYPDAVVEYWFKNPKKFIEYFKMICGDKEKHSIIYHLQFDFRLLKEHYSDESTFLHFCNTILQEKNTLLTATLGCIIGKSCKGNDGLFPHEFTRIILEKNDDCLNRHFTMGYINSIGVRCVGVGNAEFDKAKEFEENAKILAIKYPITSSLLIYLSEFHKRTGNEDRKYDLLGL